MIKLKQIVTIGQLDWIEAIAKHGDGILLSDGFHGAQSPKSFTMNEIKEGINRTKTCGLICAVRMNRMYAESEIQTIESYMRQLIDWHVDWIYYQDPAVYMVAETLGVQNKLVYDPDTLMTNSRDVQYMLDQGIHHAVLSKEITLEEMVQILNKLAQPVEAILFGYLKLATSKRRLIESYCQEIGVENTLFNRKDCFLIESTRNEKMPIVEDEHGTHVFMDYILCAMEEVLPLQQAGLDILRIDGNFLEKEMIIEAVAAFKQILTGSSPQMIVEEFKKKYENYPWSTGYMYQKTNLVK